MEAVSKHRSDRKRKALLAATEVFLDKGYDCTSMDDVAAKAEVSKPTVYKYFRGKERLFAETVRASTGEIEGLLPLVAESMGRTGIESSLIVLARGLLTALVQPRILRLCRLVLANSERFPDVGRSWYELGFERLLAGLAISFQSLADSELLRIDDPLLAANHFAGILLWIPINKAMFTGNSISGPEELEIHCLAAVQAFLAGYGPTTNRSDVDARGT